MTTRVPVASDDFNRADGPVGSNWSYIRETTWTANTPVVASSALRGKATGDHYQVIRWNGSGSFTDDQYAEAVIGGSAWQTQLYRHGVVARCSADLNTAADFYAFVVYQDGQTNKTTKLIKVVDGTLTELDSQSIAWVDGDVIAIECVGTTIQGLRNGALVAEVTDGSLTTGKPGILIAGSDTQNIATLDDWEGGNLESGGGSTAVPVFLHHLRQQGIS